MLLDDDVVTDGEPEAGSFSSGLRREEWIEYLFLHVGRNASAIVSDRYFDTVAKVFGGRYKGRLVVASIRLRTALDRRVEAVRNQIEKRPCDVLREDVRLASGRVQGAFHSNVETLLFSPRPVPGEIEALLDDGINIDDAVFARAFA